MFDTAQHIAYYPETSEGLTPSRSAPQFTLVKTPAPLAEESPGTGMNLTTEHRQLLLDSAINDAVIDEAVAVGAITSVTQGLRFMWNDGVHMPVSQLRPDVPYTGDDGEQIKYVFPKGAQIPFNKLHDNENLTSVLIVEGTKQQYAALSHAPGHFAVYGMSGCWGFKNADLSVVDGRDVYLLLDADISSNLDVWSAAEAMTKQLKLHGAKSVLYVMTTGTGKEGVDDVLAGIAEDRRSHMFRLWLANAAPKLPKRPKAKRPTTADAGNEDAARLFRIRDKPLHYQPGDGAREILKDFPAAITREGNIALYHNGVYRVDANAVMCVLADKLDNYYSPSYVKSTSDRMIALLTAAGKVLPERMDVPLLNCPNGMVDLRTGQLMDHDPSFMSHVQVAVAYEADMATPVYDAWLREALRQPGAGDLTVQALVDDLEETAGTMLDPTRTPSKALFLFGPSRSGKSTFLRLLKAVAGSANTSAVTLHDLGTDTFATANLYGRMLNVAADLSSKHVEDLSKFKMATGEDPLQANRKYGNQFEFTNQSLFAFSANELPTVSEASRAYAERMKPFDFPNSFAGREDKTFEPRLVAELPGILARWVRAYGRFLARGGYGQTDQVTQAQFEAKSDRVVQFFQDMCTTVGAMHGQKLGDNECTGRREVAQMFNAWAERNGGSKMGERAFFQRLAQIDGVTEVRNGRGSRAYNLTVAKADDDAWGDADEPQPDPVEESGVLADDVPRLGVQAATWRAGGSDQGPGDPEGITAPQTGACACIPRMGECRMCRTAEPSDPWAADPFGE